MDSGFGVAEGRQRSFSSLLAFISEGITEWILSTVDTQQTSKGELARDVISM